jgi:hypothetical protein
MKRLTFEIESAACKARIADLPTEGTLCLECWLPRVCVILDGWMGPPEPEPPPRFGCPRCEVVLGPCLDPAGIYAGALRHPAHSWWAWAPESIREAIAKAGIGSGEGYPSAFTCCYDGALWVGDQAVVVRTELDESQLAATWDAMGVPSHVAADAGPLRDETSAKMHEALSGLFERSVRSGYARCSPIVAGPGAGDVQLGTARVDAQLVDLVCAIFGDRVNWLARSPQDPVLVFDAGKPLAAIRLLMETVERRTSAS